MKAMMKAAALAGLLGATCALASMPPRTCLEYEVVDAGTSDAGTATAQLTSDAGDSDAGAIDAGTPSPYYPQRKCVKWSSYDHNEGGCSLAGGAPLLILGALWLARRARR